MRQGFGAFPGLEDMTAIQDLLRHFAKMFGSLAGGITGGVLVTIAHALGWTGMTPELGSAVALVLAALGTAWAPANAPKPPPTPPVAVVPPSSLKG